MIDKNFDFAEAERRLYQAWEDAGCFKPGTDKNADNYCIVIPPPNVTGSLHMGHALNNTLQDVLCRYQRMQGKNVLWQVGTDHAGIATQMVVERQMMERQEPDRRDIGREAFVQKVWEWKEESGDRITTQLRRLGASCDWSRERFTMDEGLSSAVRKVFVQLYKEGLIYRDKRLVNWDPKFETAISDLEVENIEVDGKFWHFKYPLENGDTYDFPIAFDEDGNPTQWEKRDYISIATTRPETMLGDGAVAVHPDDARYAPIVGKRCLLPLADRYIPIITDEYPDPEFGSGAVKITGAHDFNDYEVAKRNNIEMFDLMDEKARMRDADYIPEKYRRMDRFEARKTIVADIDALGLLIQVEDKKIMQPFGDRSGVVIEPLRTDQWYVDAEKLAIPAIQAVEQGRTKFVPENWDKTYYQWMRNIEPWCISRQLWWGHQIPVWYGPDKTPFCAQSAEKALEQAIEHYGEEVELTQDPDVLDTWFSSALWPFSTLGWPEKTPELEAFYPTNVLSTAFDIIFFWVARMMMMGLHFMEEVPFHTIYIHALVRDEKGAKMSKSKGNVIDPLDFMDKYGTDALRFTMTAMAAQGRDVKLSESRVAGYRNFSTKLWNAARFTQMNDCKLDENFNPENTKLILNKWIIHEASACASAIDEALATYRFNDAAAEIYQFTWNKFCDWYLEFAKPIFNGEDETAKQETRAACAWALDQILRMLHPMMPFVTEELWASSEEGRDRFLMLSSWPQKKYSYPEAATEMDWLSGLITEIRSVRSEMNIPAGAKIPLVIIGQDAFEKFELYQDLITRLARIETYRLEEEVPQGAIQIVHAGVTYALPLAGVIDIDAEKARLQKAIAKLTAETTAIEKRLGNESFIERAPAEVVAEAKSALTQAREKLAKLNEAMSRLNNI
ncbi:MAG: valine--tRNA ligase [bacterium]